MYHIQPPVLYSSQSSLNLHVPPLSRHQTLISRRRATLEEYPILSYIPPHAGAPTIDLFKMTTENADTIEPMVSVPLTDVEHITSSVKFAPTIKPTHTGSNPYKGQRRPKSRYPDPYNENRPGRFKRTIKGHKYLILITLFVFLSVIIAVAVFFGTRPKKTMFTEVPQR